ncbi:MAG: alpha/beta hydrolase [Arenicella sp.]|nr:alpha/beta hydrolase [Arenicella sp.]
MKLSVNGHETHVATGGKEFDVSLPTVLFLHGSGLDHRSWALQTRWFAYNGFGVLAPDFPEHSLSQGHACKTIEESAQWVLDFLHVVGVKKTHVVGHSQGFLSALELLKLKPDLVTSLTGIGTAAAIPVNTMLIETAKKSAMKAANMMLQWGFGSATHMGASATPGMQPIAIGRQIMGNNPLAADLQSCADYSAGDDAVSQVKAPSAMILASQDKMTPLKAGLVVAKNLNAKLTVLEGFGHMLPIEAPKQVLAALREFIVSVEEKQCELK